METKAPVCDPFVFRSVRPYAQGDRREWGMMSVAPHPLGDVLWEEPAMVHWSPLSPLTTRREFDHWQRVLAQGGTCEEFLTWQWIYEWATRSALRDRDRIREQRRQNGLADEVELSLSGWVMHLLHVFGIKIQSQSRHHRVSQWCDEEQKRFVVQFQEQCRHLQVPVPSEGEVELAFHYLLTLVKSFAWKEYDPLTEHVQSWAIFNSACRMRPSCDPTCRWLCQWTWTGTRHALRLSVVATREIKKGDELTVAVFPSRWLVHDVCSRLTRCGCGGFCLKLPSLIPLSSAHDEWMTFAQSAAMVNQGQTPDTKQNSRTSGPLEHDRTQWLDLFRTGRTKTNPTLVSELDAPMNLFWKILVRVERLLLDYPLDRLLHMQQAIVGKPNDRDQEKNEVKNKDNVFGRITEGCKESDYCTFWKAWSDIFPNKVIPASMETALYPSIPYPYFAEWRKRCTELSHAIGDRQWVDDTLRASWQRNAQS